jgi:ABC-type lipoprotein export system ATPase subunit
MLVEFRVKNFKSIRDEQILSMVANRDKSLEDTHVANLDAAPGRLLKSAAIYGPNASGKSNIIQALAFMRRMVLSSANVRRIRVNECPRFRLDGSSINDASEFEITYIDDDIRYQYGFALLGENVEDEWLLVYKTDKPQEWFRRYRDNAADSDTYKFSAHFKGQKLTWQKSTRREALFLSVAAGLNSRQLAPVFRWFSLLTVITDTTDTYYVRPNKFYEPFLKDDRMRGEIFTLIKAADLGITDIGVRAETRKRMLYDSDEHGEESPDFVEYEIVRPIFIHRYNEENTGEFELNEESMGTRRIFSLAPFLLATMRRGSTLVVDELESSLHPMLARFIVSLFNSTDNKNGAQLIFSTHNSSLLDIKEIFRRDQIWFVEKDKSQATVLYPLTDFNPRKDAAVESGYLTGRYGAIPFLTDFSAYEVLDGDGT